LNRRSSVARRQSASDDTVKAVALRGESTVLVEVHGHDLPGRRCGPRPEGAEAAMALHFKATLNDFIDLIHVYPTMSEALKIGAQAFSRDVSKLCCCAE
jgi:hypothetical protein